MCRRPKRSTSPRRAPTARWSWPHPTSGCSRTSSKPAVQKWHGLGAVPLVLAFEDVVHEPLCRLLLFVDQARPAHCFAGRCHGEKEVLGTRLDQERPGCDEGAQILVLDPTQH